MAMQLEQVVPFGRSLDEYTQMFALTQADFERSILSVADGPASFNAEGTALGYQIQSIDPLYTFNAADIKSRFYAVLDNVITQIASTPDDWNWTYHASPEALKAHRIKVTEAFCTDYEIGKAQGRYTVGELPSLGYTSDAYELGLCSHFLFLYSEQRDCEFHIDAIDEMLRVCKEVRVFPLLTLGLERSPHLPAVLSHLTQTGHRYTIETVLYEFQKGGNEMLRIYRGEN